MISPTRTLAMLGLSAGLVLVAITVAHAAKPGMGGGSHPTGTHRAQGALMGWGPHFERREGYLPGAFAPTTIPGAIKVPGSLPEASIAQPVKCPCTLVKDPLVARPIYGGLPNNMALMFKLGVGALTTGNFLTVGNPSNVVSEYNAMDTAWGPNFDPKDFQGGKYIGPR